MRWIERHRNILDFTLSSLLRRRGKNIALLAVYTLVVYGLASVLFFTHAIRREASVVLKAAPEVVVQRVTAGRHDLIPERFINAIREIKGTGSVRGRLWGYYFDPLWGANYTLVVPEDHTLADGILSVGPGVARLSALRENSVILMKAHDGSFMNFRIKEVLPAESELVAADLILISASDFRKLTGIAEGLFTDITLTVRNPREVPTVVRKISKVLPDTRPITREEILRTYEAVFDWRGGLLLAILSGAVLAFLIFAWEKASGLSAEERQEIGILKAIGWETSDVILMKFWEGTTVSLTAFLLGNILAYVHVFFASGAVFAPVLKGWSVLYPEFRLVPFIDFSQIAALFFLTVVPYTVATIVPSWRAATTDPDAVMRST